MHLGNDQARHAWWEEFAKVCRRSYRQNGHTLPWIPSKRTADLWKNNDPAQRVDSGSQTVMGFSIRAFPSMTTPPVSGLAICICQVVLILFPVSHAISFGPPGICLPPLRNLSRLFNGGPNSFQIPIKWRVMKPLADVTPSEIGSRPEDSLRIFIKSTACTRFVSGGVVYLAHVRSPERKDGGVIRLEL